MIEYHEKIFSIKCLNQPLLVFHCRLLQVPCMLNDLGFEIKCLSDEKAFAVGGIVKQCSCCKESDLSGWSSTPTRALFLRGFAWTREELLSIAIGDGGRHKGDERFIFFFFLLPVSFRNPWKKPKQNGIYRSNSVMRSTNANMFCCPLTIGRKSTPVTSNGATMKKKVKRYSNYIKAKEIKKL